jgi:hypothetical protein
VHERGGNGWKRPISADSESGSTGTARRWAPRETSGSPRFLPIPAPDSAESGKILQISIMRFCTVSRRAAVLKQGACPQAGCGVDFCCRCKVVVVVVVVAAAVDAAADAAVVVVALVVLVIVVVSLLALLLYVRLVVLLHN